MFKVKITHLLLTFQSIQRIGFKGLVLYEKRLSLDQNKLACDMLIGSFGVIWMLKLAFLYSNVKHLMQNTWCFSERATR